MEPPKIAVNNYVLLATGMARLIEKWRAEMPGKNEPGPEPREIEKYLKKAERCGIPALHVARIVLACERVFRARRITEEDIEQILAEMENGLNKPLNPVMTSFQAHVMIKAIEPQLREQIIAFMPVIPLAFEPTQTEPNAWFRIFSGDTSSRQKRTRPKSLLRDRSGPLPMPGPRVAGVMVEAVAEETKPRGSATMGVELCSVLLGRTVQGWEFKEWRNKISAISGPGEQPDDLRTWLKKRAKFAYDQSLLRTTEIMTPEAFLRRCEEDSPIDLFWLKDEEVFRKIISTKWTSGFKNPSKTRR